MPEVNRGQIVEGYWSFPEYYIDYSNINNSMTLTVIDNGGNHLVFAGHAILFPVAEEKTLQEMCDAIYELVRRFADRSLRINVIGDIETWVRDWQTLEETKNLSLNSEPILDLFDMLEKLLPGKNRHRVINFEFLPVDICQINYSSDRKLSITVDQSQVIELGGWCSAYNGSLNFQNL